MDKRYDLDRFVQAQDPVMSHVLAELEAGAKASHWMWFVFPQLAGLGHSTMARHYAISGMEEARAYVAHPVLGKRLRECTELVNRARGRTAEQIFGYPDVLKFQSCMTLFAHACPQDEAFRRALDSFYDGREDSETLRHLKASENADESD